MGRLTTLGPAENMTRGWPEKRPVELSGPYEVRKSTPPTVFAVPNKQLKVDVRKWNNPPQVLYRHMVKAKPNTTILLAGLNGEPLLVGGRYGKGKVVVFTGTVLGEAQENKLAFWESPAWPGLLAAVIKWSHQR
jgi:hypothetical protein